MQSRHDGGDGLHLCAESESEHLAPAGARNGVQVRVHLSQAERHGAGVPGILGGTPEAKKTAAKEFNLPPTGNAPTCLSVRDLRAVAPLWAEFVARTETPEETRKTLGWLRDMYAWDAAAPSRGEARGGELAGVAAHGAAPADDALGEAFILHYTWGPEIYDGDDTKVWMFDATARRWAVPARPRADARAGPAEVGIRPAGCSCRRSSSRGR